VALVESLVREHFWYRGKFNCTSEEESEFPESRNLH